MIPLISVVIPTYNRGNFLLDSVQSVLRQTHGKVECIVVDDGSTDDTQTILHEIGDSRLVSFRQEHAGVSAARNRGVAEARGSLVAFLDSDDRFLPEKLALQMKYMRDRRLHISQTAEIWIRNGRRVNSRKVHQKRSGRFFEKSVELCLVSPSCVMLTREALEEIGPFKEHFPACEDYDYWLRAGLAFDIGLLDTPLTVKYGGHRDQLSTTVIGLDLFRIKALLDILDHRGLGQDQRLAAEKELRRKARIYIRGCLKRGRSVEADRVKSMVEGRVGVLFA